LRSNIGDGAPEELWRMYLQLVEIEQAFNELKGDLAIRPIRHPLDARCHEQRYFCSLSAPQFRISLP